MTDLKGLFRQAKALCAEFKRDPVNSGALGLALGGACLTTGVLTLDPLGIAVGLGIGAHGTYLATNTLRHMGGFNGPG